jgi:hypothetical protein
MPARTRRGTVASSTVPQAWHSPHRPTHFGACQPHSVHRNAAVDFAMAAPYRHPPTFAPAPAATHNAPATSHRDVAPLRSRHKLNG